LGEKDGMSVTLKSLKAVELSLIEPSELLLWKKQPHNIVIADRAAICFFFWVTEKNKGPFSLSS